MPNQLQPANTRRKFLHWGGLSSLTLLAGFSLRKIFSSRDNLTVETAAKPTMVKMLTQDGKLVAIPVAQLPKKKHKITDAAVHDWVKL